MPDGGEKPQGEDDSTTEKKRGPAMAERLIAFADEHFEVFPSRDGRINGVRRDDPTRAYAHGKGSSPLMGEIKTMFHLQHGRWPDSKAAAACSDYLEVRASRTRSVEVALRSHFDGRRLLVDVGDDTGRVLQIDADGFRYLDTSPVSFRRSPVTAALAEPAARGDLNDLWRQVKVVERDRPLVLALLIVAWMTGVAQPVVFVTGPQDAGKTETARALLQIVDPVTIQERGGSLPKSEEEWKPRLAQYRAVLIDNASHITPASSDALCKVATGGEATTRALYTNDAAHVSDMQAPVCLTSIGVGALRGDLQSRMVRIELEALDPESRLALSDLRAAREQVRPSVTRALLDLTVQVLALLPVIDRTGLSTRLTDFELVLRCIDKTLGTDGCARLAEVADELSQDVIDADPVAQALLRGIEDEGSAFARPVLGRPTSTELLASLTYYAKELGLAGASWPRTPKVLADHLRRIAPALAAHGLIVDGPKKTNGARRFLIARSTS